MNEEQWQELMRLCLFIYPGGSEHIEEILDRLQEIYDKKDDREILSLFAEYSANKMYFEATIVGLYLTKYGGW